MTFSTFAIVDLPQKGLSLGQIPSLVVTRLLLLEVVVLSFLNLRFLACSFSISLKYRPISSLGFFITTRRQLLLCISVFAFRWAGK